MAAKKKEPGIEENFESLEEIIEKLELSDTTLEESFKLYTSGMELLKNCNKQIDRVEKQVLKLTEEGTLEEL